MTYTPSTFERLPTDVQKRIFFKYLDYQDLNGLRSCLLLNRYFYNLTHNYKMHSVKLATQAFKNQLEFFEYDVKSRTQNIEVYSTKEMFPLIRVVFCNDKVLIISTAQELKLYNQQTKTYNGAISFNEMRGEKGTITLQLIERIANRLFITSCKTMTAENLRRSVKISIPFVHVLDIDEERGTISMVAQFSFAELDALYSSVGYEATTNTNILTSIVKLVPRTKTELILVCNNGFIPNFSLVNKKFKLINFREHCAIFGSVIQAHVHKHTLLTHTQHLQIEASDIVVDCLESFNMLDFPNITDDQAATIPFDKNQMLMKASPHYLCISDLSRIIVYSIKDITSPVCSKKPKRLNGVFHSDDFLVLGSSDGTGTQSTSTIFSIKTGKELGSWERKNSATYTGKAWIFSDLFFLPTQEYVSAYDYDPPELTQNLAITKLHVYSLLSGKKVGELDLKSHNTPECIIIDIAIDWMDSKGLTIILIRRLTKLSERLEWNLLYTHDLQVCQLPITPTPVVLEVSGQDDNKSIEPKNEQGKKQEAEMQNEKKG